MLPVALVQPFELLPTQLVSLLLGTDHAGRIDLAGRIASADRIELADCLELVDQHYPADLVDFAELSNLMFVAVVCHMFCM